LAFLGDLYFHRLVPRLLLLFQCFEPEREVFLDLIIRLSRCLVILVLYGLFYLSFMFRVGSLGDFVLHLCSVLFQLLTLCCQHLSDFLLAL